MKKILLSLALLLAIPCFGQVFPYNILLTQRTPDNQDYTSRVLPNPANSANGIIYFNGTTQLPGYLVLGTGLSVSDGVMSASGGGTQADWNATTGPSRILNKPTISTVGMTGQYSDLFGAPTIPTVTAFNFGMPSARTLGLSTAYQANDATKASIITVSPQCTASITLVTGATCVIQARIGTASLTCSTGTPVATWANGNTGTLTIGLALNQIVGAPGAINLPSGAYFILCPVSGTFTINSAVDQPAG